MATEGSWPIVSLGELVENLDSARVPVKAADRRPGPYPYYGASGVVDHVDGYLFDGEHLLVAEDGENLRTRKTPVAFIARGKFWVNNHAHILRGNKRADTRYLMYALSRADVGAYLTGSTQPKLTQGALHRIPVPAPPLPEQRRIANTLGALDDKIELNRRMNCTLESMARAIFESWFVDFDPVRKKMKGGEVGLPPDLAALFPASFDDLELGLVPAAWEQGSLGNVAALNSDTWSSSTRPDVLQYVDLSNTKWGRIEARTTYARADAPSRAQRVLRSGDTIVGTVRPGNGSYAYISEDGLTGSTGFAALRPFEANYREFVYLAATAPDNIASLALLADGAAYPAVRPEAVTATPVALAPHDVMARFAQLAAPLFERMAHNGRESDLLTTLRDGLLPRLVLRQLTMQGAERVAQ